MNKTKRINYLLFIFFFIGITVIISLQVLAGEQGAASDEYKIEYTIKNSPDSEESIKNITVFLGDDTPSFIDFIRITPGEAVSEIAQNSSQLFNLYFKIDQGQKVPSSAEIKLKPLYDPSQILNPVFDTITIKDDEKPNISDIDIYPTVMEPGDIIRAIIYVNDTWSGVNLERTELICNGQIRIPSNIRDNGDGSGIVTFKFSAPLKEGSYNVYINSKDYASNTISIEKRIRVRQRDQDPVNADESKDFFDSYKGNEELLDIVSINTEIIKSGFYQEMAGLLRTFKESYTYIKPEEFSPELLKSYPVIIFPSASFIQLKEIKSIKEKLLEYVSGGGVILVFTQPNANCYNILPDKVECIGYVEDKACYDITANISLYNYVMSGQTDEMVSGTVDGIFTSWPANTEVWLRRAKNNFPSMLSYSIGKGKIILTNYYSDYAYGHSQLKEDERRVIRDLLTWVKEPIALPELHSGEDKKISFSVTNNPENSSSGIDKIKIIIRDPDRNIIYEDNISKELKPGETAELEYIISDIDNKYTGEDGENVGIWWLNYELYKGNDLVKKETAAQRFAISKRLNLIKEPEITATVEALNRNFIQNDLILFEVIIHNNCKEIKSVNCDVMRREGINLSTLDSSYYFENIPAQSEKKYVIMLKPISARSVVTENWDKNWWSFIFFDENGNKITTEERGINVYKPSIQITTELNKLSNYYPGDELIIDVYQENKIPFKYPIEYTIKLYNPNNVLVKEQSYNNMIEDILYNKIEYEIPKDEFLIGKWRVAIEYKNEITYFYDTPKIFTMLYDFNIKELKIDEDCVFKWEIENPCLVDLQYKVIWKLYENNKLIENFEGTYDILTGNTVKDEIKLNNINRYFEEHKLIYEVYNQDYMVSKRQISFIPYEIGSNISAYNNSGNSMHFNVYLKNKSLPVTDLKLKLLVKGNINKSCTVNLPDMNTEQEIDMPIDLELEEPVESGNYPVDVLVIDKDGKEKLLFTKICKIAPIEISVDVLLDYSIDDDYLTIPITNNSQNKSEIDCNFELMDREITDTIFLEPGDTSNVKI